MDLVCPWINLLYSKTSQNHKTKTIMETVGYQALVLGKPKSRCVLFLSIVASSFSVSESLPAASLYKELVIAVYCQSWWTTINQPFIRVVVHPYQLTMMIHHSQFCWVSCNLNDQLLATIRHHSPSWTISLMAETWWYHPPEYSITVAVNAIVIGKGNNPL